MSFRHLTLNPDRNAWDMQPTETSKSYARFEHWLNQRPSQRTFTSTAEKFKVSVSLIAKQADAHQWRARARLYDSHRATLRRQQNEERDTALAQINMASALAAADVTRRSIEHVRDSGVVLEPVPLKAWVSMMLDLRRSAMEQPDQVVQIRGSEDQPVRVEHTVEDFAGLSPEAKRARAQEIVEGVQRLYAINGGKSA